jgi:hypothetical protein
VCVCVCVCVSEREREIEREKERRERKRFLSLSGFWPQSLAGNSTLMRCVNPETSLLTNIHQVLTLCVFFHQGLDRKQITHLK